MWDASLSIDNLEGADFVYVLPVEGEFQPVPMQTYFGMVVLDYKDIKEGNVSKHGWTVYLFAGRSLFNERFTREALGKRTAKQHPGRDWSGRAEANYGNPPPGLGGGLNPL